MAEADPTERELLVQVPEGALPDLARARAQAMLWARPDEPIAATLREVAPQADATLRTYAARFRLPDAPDWAALVFRPAINCRVAATKSKRLSSTPLNVNPISPPTIV